MTLRLKKLFLFLLALILWITGAGVVWWGTRPLPAGRESLSSNPRESQLSGHAETNIKQELTQKNFDKHWNIPLRRELYDPKPPPPKVVKKPKPKPIKIQLVATTIEDNNTSAWIKDTKGNFVKRKIGDVIDSSNKDALVFKINEDSIIIKRGEEEIKKTIAQ